jgi:two-component system, NtrC family, nitrogen regulation response regulator GlnG
MSGLFEGATMTFGGQSQVSGASGIVVPALSILWHPDAARVGEVLPLVAKTISISRLQPLFSKAGTQGHGQPLADPYLSRSPWLELELAQDGAVVIRPQAHQVEVDCTVVPSAGLELSAERIGAGVVLSICRPAARIVFCLHRLRIPVERGPTLGLVGQSDALEHVRSQIARVVDLDVPVLIRGETGTGKELVSRALAYEGAAKREPFIAVNMSTFAKNVAGAELFGHERGAFTGAVAQRAGAFVEAEGGTLFLDEIATASMDVQHMLLRALQEGEVRPIGSSRPRKVQVRVVAATDADLEREVEEGRFHEALLHRLGYRVNLPPLRERREDVGPLFLHLVRKHLALAGEPDRLAANLASEEGWIPPAFVARLAANLPAGNVRGLENVARQLVISNRGRTKARIDADVERLLRSSPSIAPVTSPEPPTPPPVREGPPPSELTAGDLERALEDNRWVFAGAAKALKVSRTTLYQLIQREGIARPAESITEEEAREAFEELGGDVDAMAAKFRTSRYALSQRLRALGLVRGR